MAVLKQILLALIVTMPVCLIPVVVLYAFFGQQNYFELDGWVKGLVVSGPIGAYLFLVWLTFRFYKQIVSLLIRKKAPLIDDKEARKLEMSDVPDLTGKWEGIWEWSDPETNEIHVFTEAVDLNQEGRIVTGTIEDRKEGLTAKLRGEIYNHILTIYYVSDKMERLSCGSLTLLQGDGQSLTGFQIYYDVIDHKLHTASYELKKK